MLQVWRDFIAARFGRSSIVKYENTRRLEVIAPFKHSWQNPDTGKRVDHETHKVHVSLVRDSYGHCIERVSLG
jgi:hypothetical protein